MDHLVCVVSGRGGTIVSHRAGGGRLCAVVDSTNLLEDPRWIYPSQDGTTLYVGGVFESANGNGAVAAWSATRKGLLKDVGYWFTNNSLPLSLWESPKRPEIYVSTSDALLRYRSRALADLRSYAVASTPLTSSKPNGAKTIALYAPDHSGKMTRKWKGTMGRPGARLGEEADFYGAAAAAEPGRYLLYYWGVLLSVSKTAYLSDGGIPTITVCDVAPSQRALSYRQRVRLPEIAPKAPFRNRSAIVTRHPSGKFLSVWTHRSGRNKIYQLAIRPDCLLVLRKERTITIKGGLISGIAFSPDGGYAYVLDDNDLEKSGRIHVFSINRDGSIKQTEKNSVETVQNPVAFAVHAPPS